MVACVAIGDVIWQTALLIDHLHGINDPDYWPRDTISCQVLAFFLLYGGFFNWIWIFAMCVDLFYITFYSLEKSKRFSLKIFVVLSGIPLITAIVFACTGLLGPNVIVCFSRVDKDIGGLLLAILCLSSCFVILVGYIVIGFKMHHLSHTSHNAAVYKKAIRKIAIYPLFYVLCWSSPPAYVIFQVVNRYTSEGISVYVVFFTGINGLLNCIAYFFLRTRPCNPYLSKVSQ